MFDALRAFGAIVTTKIFACTDGPYPLNFFMHPRCASQLANERLFARRLTRVQRIA